ncbi:MAG: hypothetical protein OEZ33_06855 [Gammaproteobacteria bacterium]|nr:hypothetical protein [Gammaproteobacteria bacterium]
MNRLILFLFLPVMLISTACVHNEDGGVNPVASLQGDWKGVHRDAGGTFRSLTASIDGSGNITRLQVFNQDVVTGTITSTGDKTFSYQLSDGSQGGFMADASGNHLGFLADDNAYGVMEKGATLQYSQSGNFTATDFNGSWTGYSVELNANMDVIRQYTSSANISSPGVFDGSTPDGTFAGSLEAYSDSKGYAYGVYGTSNGESGYVTILLSPDKTFLATWGCLSGAAANLVIYDITECAFGMWTK